jgi:ribosomal protein S18 acetylase RimI-like enzyme
LTGKPIALDYTVRPFQWADLAAVAALYNAAAEADGEMHRVTVDALEREWSVDHFDAERDIVVVTLPDGQIIGAAYVEWEDDPVTFADCEVHPDFRGLGIGEALLTLTEQRALERADAAMPDAPSINLDRVTLDGNEAAIGLYTRHRYSHVRTYYVMKILLESPVEEPPLPEGVELRPFDRQRDVRAVYDAHAETFTDHWSYHMLPYEEWVELVLNRPECANAGEEWLVAWAGDQIAGICLNRRIANDPQAAWTMVVGVRREWRKRGLAYALLRRTFSLYQRKGFREAALAVDSSSLTNAVALYERAGMHVSLRRLLFRKPLRGELSLD